MSETSAMKKGTGLRILVADDNQNMREVLTRVLASEGYDVTTAESAERALDLLNTNHYPLIISDIRMPGMNGIELLQKIRATDSDTQVIIMTKHATLDTAISALRAGAYDYLLKPFEDLSLISTAVGRAVEKIRMAIENKILVQRLKKRGARTAQQRIKRSRHPGWINRPV